MKLKWVLIGIAAVIVVAIAGVVIVLSTMSFDDLKPRIEAEARKATGRDLTISGPIELQVSLNPAIQVSDITFANADWGSRPQMINLKELDLQVSLVDLLNGDIKVERLVLVEPDILLETNADGQGNWAFTTAAEPTETEASSDNLSVPSFDLIEVRDGTLTYRDGRSGEEHRVALTSVTAQAAGMNSPIALSLDGSYNETALSLSGTFGALADLELGPYPVDFTAEVGGATATIAGDLGQPLSGTGMEVNVAIKGDDLPKLAAIVGADAPPIGAFDLSAEVVSEGSIIGVNKIDANVSGSQITGNASLSIDGPRPSISGNIAVDRFDVTTFSNSPDSASAGDDQGKRFLIPDTPLPLDGLHAVDADLGLEVRTMRVSDQLNLNNVKAAIKLTDGKLALTPLTTGLSGGTINLNLDLNDATRPPRLNAKTRIRNIDFGQLLKTLAVSQDVTGTLDANIDVNGRGQSPRALATGLNGRVEIIRGQGTIDNDLVKIAATGLEDILSPLMGDRDNMKLNCLVVRFDIKDGIATSQALVIDTDAFTILGSGTINLKTEALDLRFDTDTKGVNLASLTGPFNVTGTMAQPSASPDAAGIAKGAAKIAGTIIMPIPAIVGMIGDSQLSGSEKNACLAAIEAAQEKTAGGATPEADKSVIDDTAEGVTGTLEDVGEGISEGIKSLFGD